MIMETELDTGRSEEDLVGLCQGGMKVLACPKRIPSFGTNGEQESRKQPANPGLPEK